MNLRMNGPGRPRQYESTSMKVEAYRKRLESAGYLRKELLVTQETAAMLQWLAEKQGVSMADVAGALLEYGLERYKGEHLAGKALAEEDPTGNWDQDAGVPAPLGTLQQDALLANDPVQAFVARRKGTTK